MFLFYSLVIPVKHLWTLLIQKYFSSSNQQLESLPFIYRSHYEMCLLLRENRQQNRLEEMPVRNGCDFREKNRRESLRRSSQNRLVDIHLKDAVVKIS